MKKIAVALLALVLVFVGVGCDMGALGGLGKLTQEQIVAAALDAYIDEFETDGYEVSKNGNVYTFTDNSTTPATVITLNAITAWNEISLATGLSAPSGTVLGGYQGTDNNGGTTYQYAIAIYDMTLAECTSFANSLRETMTVTPAAGESLDTIYGITTWLAIDSNRQVGIVHCDFSVAGVSTRYAYIYFENYSN